MHTLHFFGWFSLYYIQGYLFFILQVQLIQGCMPSAGTFGVFVGGKDLPCGVVSKEQQQLQIHLGLAEQGSLTMCFVEQLFSAK
jgi:hypothetical protein|mmetsp:Transcript_1582/g.2894  ORF Transcript_1582/g.2894 Transcript_1582/m.2894 type:complete len:84 (+) Transcript_1582:1002-1253(+)